MKYARNLEDLGKLVKFHRMKTGKTQSELASSCGVSQELISKIENGHGGSLHTFILLAQALNLELRLEKIQEIDTNDLAGMMGN